MRVWWLCYFLLVSIIRHLKKYQEVSHPLERLCEMNTDFYFSAHPGGNTVSLHCEVTLTLGPAANPAFGKAISGVLSTCTPLVRCPALPDFLLSVKGRKPCNYQDSWGHVQILSLTFTGCMTFAKFLRLPKPGFSRLLTTFLQRFEGITSETPHLQKAFNKSLSLSRPCMYDMWKVRARPRALWRATKLLGAPRAALGKATPSESSCLSSAVQMHGRTELNARLVC